MPTDIPTAEPSEERSEPSVAKGLLLGTGVTLVALALSALLHPYLDTHAALPPVVAVLIAVWYGGLAGGLTATALSVVGLHLIFLDKGRDTAVVTLADLLQGLFFTAIAVAASVAGNSLRRMRRRLALRHREVEDLHLAVRATRAAQETEAQRFRLLADEVKDYGVCMLDAEGRVTTWSPGAERLLGWREDEILGRGLETLYPSPAPEEDEDGEDGEDGVARQLLRRARRHGRAESEGWSVRRDGSRFPSRTSVSALRDPDGRLVGFAKVLRDTTPPAPAAGEPAGSPAASVDVAEVLESITDAFFTLDREWRFAFLNAQAEQMLQRPRGELLGRVVWKEFPDATGSNFQREYEQAMATGRTRTFTEFYAPLGAWFEVRAYPSAAGLSVYFTDITARRAAEQALAAREAEYRFIAEAIPQLLFIATTEGRLTYVNRQWQEYTGIVLDQAGMDAAAVNRRVVHPEDLERVTAEYHEALATGQPAAIELRLRRADGSYHWFLSRLTPIPDHEGRIVEWLGSSTDVDEQKQAAEALRHTQKLESVGLLAGGVAHDFNNLLTGIMGNTSLALRALPAEVRSGVGPLLDEVIAASERAAELTKQLLAYAGKGRFVIEPVDLGRLVPDIAGLVRASVPRLVEVEFDLAPGLAPVQADASQLQQLVMNLVLNGAEAIGEEAGRVRVTTRPARLAAADLERLRDFALAPGDYVELAVADTGAGMDEATQARMFDPFFTTKFLGRGLGLSATLGIVRGHRGAIAVESAPGRGTTVRVWLPAMRAAAPATAVAGSQPPTGAVRGPTPGAGGRTVLIVDDEVEVRRFMRAALESFGHAVLEAVDGRDGVARLAEHAAGVDLVVLDMVMPVMGGEEAIVAMRRVRPGVPVIVTSGYGDVEAMRRFTGLGADEFLQKPFTADTLEAKVRSALDTAVSGGRRAVPESRAAR